MKYLVRILICIAALCLLPAAAGAETASGECGEGITWSLDGGTLTVSGNGPMSDFEEGAVPWAAYKEQITSVVLSGNVTTVDVTDATLGEALKLIVKEKVAPVITITNPTDTHILQIGATTEDPKLSKKISNAMADAVAENISSVMATDKPSIAERAVTPKAPSSPNLIKNTAMGALLGAVLAMGVIILLYLMDDTIKTEDDVRKYLQMNTLAAFPLEKKRKKSA